MALLLQKKNHTVNINNLQQYVIHHPDPDIDICLIVCQPIIASIEPGFELRHVMLSKDWRVDKEFEEIIRPVESVLMVGYPNGLWDAVGNRPITRRGTTASHPLLRWNNKRQFVIDAACFPGSSGSPVFLYEDGFFRQATGITPGQRCVLIGTLWGGPVISAEGKLEEREIPTSVPTPIEQFPVTRVMMNLGFVVHASALDDFIPILEKLVTIPA